MEKQQFYYFSRPITGHDMYKPISLFWKGTEYPLSGKWRNLIIKICDLLEQDYPGKLFEIVNGNGRKSWCLHRSSNNLIRPYHHRLSDVWIELSQEVPSILKTVRDACSLCGAPLNKINLIYTKNEKDISLCRDTMEPIICTNEEKIGAYAKRELYAALAEDRVPDEDYKLLLTHKGTLKLLGLPLSGKPLFSRSRMTKPNGSRVCWAEPAIRHGKKVYVNAQWYKGHRTKLEQLLERWRETIISPLKKEADHEAETSHTETTPAQIDHIPDVITDEKIGLYAKRELYLALSEGRIPEEDFKQLQTVEGTKELLGVSLTTCPLFSYSIMIRRDGNSGCWKEPAVRDGKKVYVNSQWHKEYRAKLDQLLARWSRERPIASRPIPKSQKVLVDFQSFRADFLKLLKDLGVGGTITGEVFGQIQSENWCNRVLHIRKPLIHRLRFYETLRDYAVDYVPLHPYIFPEMLIYRKLENMDLNAFRLWVKTLETDLANSKVKTESNTMRPDDIKGSGTPHNSIQSAQRHKSLSQIRAELHAAQEAKRRQMEEEVARREKERREMEEKVGSVLRSSFPNGMRIESVIDKNKFRRSWNERYGEESLDEDNLSEILSCVGIAFAGKVFAKSEGNSLLVLVRQLTESAHGIFYYDTLFSAESEQFMRMGVQTGEMLRTALMQEAPDAFTYGRVSFAGKDNPNSLPDVLARSFAERETWSRDDLCRYFPYVPPERITFAFAADSRFVRVKEGEYRLASAILLDEEECHDAVQMVTDGVEKNGYFTLAAIPLSKSRELNGDVLMSAVLNQFFARYLSGGFELHGNFISRKGTDFDTSLIIRDFCRTYGEVTYKQLAQFKTDYRIGDAIILRTVNEEMVQVNEHCFVSPDSIQFDVDGIDTALSFMVPSAGMPLVSIETFSTFPSVAGYPWNLYLLMAFLRRESRVFNYFTISEAWRRANGMIVRKSVMVRDATEAFAQAVLSAGVTLTEDAIGKYLAQKGYILQRRADVEALIVKRIRQLRGVE